MLFFRVGGNSLAVIPAFESVCELISEIKSCPVLNTGNLNLGESIDSNDTEKFREYIYFRNALSYRKTRIPSRKKAALGTMYFSNPLQRR